MRYEPMAEATICLDNAELLRDVKHWLDTYDDSRRNFRGYPIETGLSPRTDRQMRLAFEARDVRVLAEQAERAAAKAKAVARQAQAKAQTRAQQAQRQVRRHTPYTQLTT